MQKNKISIVKQIAVAFALVCYTVNSFAITCSIPGNAGPNAAVTAYPNGLYPGTVGSTLAAGAASINVGALVSGPAVAAGSLLMIIQMQGATINSTNSNQYGDGTGTATVVPASPNPGIAPVAGDLTAAFGAASYAGGTTAYTAGTYEYVVATGPAVGGVIPLTSPLVNSYSNLAATTTSGQTRYQVIVIPQYSSATVSGTHTVPAWDGATGGVEVIDVAGALTLTATINGDGRGFRGGAGVNQTAQCTLTATAGACQDYRSTNANQYGAFKGEGIAGTPAFVYSTASGTSAGAAGAIDGYPNGDRSRGAPGNAGGGGNQHNAGGGGGGNGGAGGKGGRSWNSSDATLSGLEVGGYGGASGYATPARLVMGGGGGAGDQNDSTAPAGSGGSGGALVIVRAGSITGASTINVNGGNGLATTGTDAAGAGGAGGTVLITATTGGINGVTINARGGNGAGGNQAGSSETDGPGGGGGGGVVFSNVALGTAPNVAGGAAGAIVNTTNTQCLSTNAALATCGATAGGAGVISSAAAIPIANTGSLPGSECLPNITATKTTTTPVLDLAGAATGAASYQIDLVNTGGGARAVNIIDNALPPGWVLAGTPTYTYTPTPPQTGNNLPSGADSSVAPTVNPVAGAPVAAPAAGANSLAWNSFFIAPIKNDVPSRIRINFNATVPANAPVGCYHNPVGFNFLDPTRTTAAGTQVTSGTNNSANRAAASYGASTYTAGNVVTNVAGANYSGLAAGPTGEDVCIRPDLQITKTNSNAAPAVGVGYNYTLTVRNNGHQIADTTYAANQTTTLTAVAAGPNLSNLVNDTLPADIVLTGTPTGANWTCTGAAGSTSFACTYTGAYPMAAATDLTGAITVPVKATTAACPAAKINTATLNGAQFAGNGVAGTLGEFNAANNTATDGVGITPNCSASITVSKTDGKASNISGDTNIYTLTVSNAGVASADGLFVTDVVGSNLTCPAANAVTCVATAPAVCPSGPFTIANLTGAGIQVGNIGAATLAGLGSLPSTGSLAFSYSCTVP